MPDKINAIVLNILPFRETSVIVYLFTDRFGLLHGIAKGIRSAKKGATPMLLERGFLVELFVYHKSHRDLHLVSNITVLDFFPGTREDLLKSAMRDAAFEAIIKGITDSLSHPELFSYFTEFLSALEQTHRKQCFPFALWSFFYHFSAAMGFRLAIGQCMRCKKVLGGPDEGFLIAAAGGVVCKGCRQFDERDKLLPAGVLQLLRSESGTVEPGVSFPAYEAKRITRLLAYYCWYHFESRSLYKSLEFLDELFDEPGQFPPHPAAVR